MIGSKLYVIDGHLQGTAIGGDDADTDENDILGSRWEVICELAAALKLRGNGWLRIQLRRFGIALSFEMSIRNNTGTIAACGIGEMPNYISFNWNNKETGPINRRAF